MFIFLCAKRRVRVVPVWGGIVVGNDRTGGGGCGSGDGGGGGDVSTAGMSNKH